MHIVLISQKQLPLAGDKLMSHTSTFEYRTVLVTAAPPFSTFPIFMVSSVLKKLSIDIFIQNY